MRKLLEKLFGRKPLVMRLVVRAERQKWTKEDAQALRGLFRSDVWQRAQAIAMERIFEEISPPDGRMPKDFELARSRAEGRLYQLYDLHRLCGVAERPGMPFEREQSLEEFLAKVSQQGEEDEKEFTSIQFEEDE